MSRIQNRERLVVTSTYFLRREGNNYDYDVVSMAFIFTTFLPPLPYLGIISIQINSLQ